MVGSTVKTAHGQATQNNHGIIRNGHRCTSYATIIWRNLHRPQNTSTRMSRVCVTPVPVQTRSTRTHEKSTAILWPPYRTCSGEQGVDGCYRELHFKALPNELRERTHLYHSHSQHTMPAEVAMNSGWIQRTAETHGDERV